MAKRSRVIEILAPTLGRNHALPRTMLDTRMQPDGLNGKMYYGVNQKEYGTTIYCTGTASAGSTLGAPINGIFTANYPNGSDLQVFTHTGVYRYTSTGDAFVSDGQTFTGTFSDYWSACMYNDDLFYTNGINHIQVKTGIGSTGTDMGSALTSSTLLAWCVQPFHEHLNLYHVTENGTEYYKRVRWAKQGSLTLSGTGDFWSGTAGASDLQDAVGEVKTAVPLGEAMVVLAENSIHAQFWVGGSGVYKFTKVISGVGTPSRRGAISQGEIVYFIGWGTFYAYYGGYDIRDIGAPISSKAFGEANAASLASTWVEYNGTFDEIHFHMPVAGTMTDVVWVYRLENSSWSRLERPYTAKGETSRATGTTIGELQGTIGDQTWAYGDYKTQTSAETEIYGDTGGQVVKLDPTVYSLNIAGTTTAQTFRYYTPSLTASGAKDPYDDDEVNYSTRMKRWTQLNLEATGNGTAIVEYSTDGGINFSTFAESPITLAVTGTTHVLDMDISSRTLDLRVSNTATNDNIGITYLKVEFIPGSEH